MPSPSNPFEDLRQLFERLNREFRRTTYGADGTGIRLWGPDPDLLALDTAEDDEAFVVTVDLPGLEREDVRVRVTDGTLRIDAERGGPGDTDRRYVRKERHHAPVHRTVRLPEEVDVDAASARMNNGVLTVTLPKRADTRGRDVDVE